MRIVEHDRSEVRIFPALGVQYGCAKAPRATVDATLLSMKRTAEVAMEQLDDAAGKAKANRSLSPIGIREATKAFRQRADDAIAVLHHNSTADLARLRGQREALFTPPQLDASDAVGALFDREIRERFSTLSQAQRSTALADERVVHALARDPFNNIPKQVALAVLRKQVETTNAEELATLDAKTETAEWLSSAAAAMRYALDATAKEFGKLPPTAKDIAEGLRAEQTATTDPVPAAAPTPRPETQEDIITAVLRERAERRRVA